MDSAPQSQLGAAGATAGDTPFSVIIGGPGEVGCTNGKLASLLFDASSSPVDTMFGRLRNDTGTATNVLVGILDGARNPIDLRTNTNTPQATIAGNTATLNFIAQYYVPFMAATAGTVQTYAMYSIQYN
jgi:major type 1 subunit fimbrin (pilin)